MTDDRVPPEFVGDERTLLNSWLDWQRATLAVKCDGLSEEQLRERSVPPSTMSLLGIVRHMAHVERAWFQRILADEDVPLLYDKETRPDCDFDDVDTASVPEAFTIWQTEIEHSRRVSSAMDLDPLRNPLRHGRPVSHRRTLLHLIQEYARHHAHADFLRQRIDGTTGE